jgi:hypothetical protein
VTLNSGENILQNHLLQTQETKPSIRDNHAQVWPSVLMLLCLIILVLVKVRSWQKLIMIVRSVFLPRELQQIEREDLSPFRFYAISLNLFFVLNLSFLLYKVNALYKIILIEEHPYTQYAVVLACVGLFAGFRSIVNRTLVFVTAERKALTQYISNSTLLTQAAGLFLFPLVILAEFTEYDPLIFISAAFIILGVTILIKWYRGLISSIIETRIGILQIFSYFCALEILPILVLVKFTQETFLYRAI